jgi:CRP-like cAMP-binding protein
LKLDALITTLSNNLWFNNWIARKMIISPGMVNKLALFSGIPEEDKKAMLVAGHIRNITRGHTLFLHGESVAYFYIVISGAIQLFRVNQAGNEKTISLVEPGQTICEDEILNTSAVHRLNAKAVENTVLIQFTSAWLRENVRKYNCLAFNLLNLMADHSHEFEVEAEQQATMSSAQLVACFLQKLCVLHKLDPAGYGLPYSKTLIASRLGMELETFSRALTKLRQHGIIIKGSRVSINNPSLLRQYVCNFCSIADECPTYKAIHGICNSED